MVFGALPRFSNQEKNLLKIIRNQQGIDPEGVIGAKRQSELSTRGTYLHLSTTVQFASLLEHVGMQAFLQRKLDEISRSYQKSSEQNKSNKSHNCAHASP